MYPCTRNGLDGFSSPGCLLCSMLPPGQRLRLEAQESGQGLRKVLPALLDTSGPRLFVVPVFGFGPSVGSVWVLVRPSLLSALPSGPSLVVSAPRAGVIGRRSPKRKSKKAVPPPRVSETASVPSDRSLHPRAPGRSLASMPFLLTDAASVPDASNPDFLSQLL